MHKGHHRKVTSVFGGLWVHRLSGMNRVCVGEVLQVKMVK